MILFGCDVYPCAYYIHYIYKLGKWRILTLNFEEFKKYRDSIPEKKEI